MLIDNYRKLISNSFGVRMDRQSEMSLFFRVVDEESCSTADRIMKTQAVD